MQNEPKAGVKTTEFWLSVAGLLVVVLVSSRVVPAADAAQLTDTLSHGVREAAALLTTLGVIKKYIDHRAAEKAAAAPKS